MLLNVKEVDVQLKEKIYINDRSQGGGCITIHCYSNYNEPGHNIDKKMFNIYNSNWFQLILDIVTD